MRNIFQQTVQNLDESRAVAVQLCQDYLSGSDTFTLFLEGGLGAGKTYMVGAMLEYLGITAPITSPTYSLVNEYDNEDQKFAHFDFYRLEEPNDFFARGFSDLSGEAGTSHFVEWVGKISNTAKSSFNGPQFTLKIDLGDTPTMRTMTLYKHD